MAEKVMLIHGLKKEWEEHSALGIILLHTETRSVHRLKKKKNVNTKVGLGGLWMLLQAMGGLGGKKVANH